LKTDRIPEPISIDEPAESKGAIDINFKRVFSRMLQFWYVIPLFLIITFTIAYIVNRYSTRIYPVTASILIKENDENAGAKFLYNNELINPYRNFYNEIYIIRSYPLLQEVIMSLGFEVSFHREGDFKTTEYYDPHFPVKFHILPTGTKPYGRSFLFTIKNEKTFSLQHVADDEESGKKFDDLLFNDTLKINGYRLFAQSRGDVKPFVG
jgi:hypothetical protein